MSDAETFHPRELFQALARHEVEYVTVGGIAVQAHGGQRVTRDLDVAIAASRQNLERLAAALADLDGRILGPDGQRSRSVPSAAMLGSGDQWHLVTDYGRLDVLTVPAHLGSFADMRARAHEVSLGDVTVPIAPVREAARHAAPPAGFGEAPRLCTTRATAARRSASRSTASRPPVVRR